MSDTPMKTIEDAVRELGGVWPKSDPSSEVLVWIGSGWTAWRKDWAGKSFNDWYEVCTRAEFEECTRRLRNEPKPEDAPDWAGAWAQDNDGDWYWYEAVPRPSTTIAVFRSSGGKVIHAGRGKVIGSWYNTLRLRPKENKVEDINSWYKRGEFPPVGTVCEMLSSNYWQKVKIVGWDGGDIVIASDIIEGRYRGLVPGQSDFRFRPLQTERERWVEKAYDIYAKQAPSHSETWTDVLKRIYDAGLAKMPEDNR